MTKAHDPIPGVASLRPGQPGPFRTTGFFGPEQVDDFIAIRSCIAVNSDTSGLHLLIRAYGISDGDEIITTSFSFIASSNCILYEREKPVFVGIEPDTANIDASLIEQTITPRTRAILAVDAFGQPARPHEVRDVARKHGLVFIEDSCESLGSVYRGKKAGGPNFADAAVFARVRRDDRHRRRPHRGAVRQHAQPGPVRGGGVAGAREAGLQLPDR